MCRKVFFDNFSYLRLSSLHGDVAFLPAASDETSPFVEDFYVQLRSVEGGRPELCVEQEPLEGLKYKNENTYSTHINRRFMQINVVVERRCGAEFQPSFSCVFGGQKKEIIVTQQENRLDAVEDFQQPLKIALFK